MSIPRGMDQNDPAIWLGARQVKMDIESLECTSVAMRASYMRGIIPSDSHATRDVIRETVSMSIWTAHIKTEVEKEVADEVTRASLKPPPGKLQISLLSASGDLEVGAPTGPRGNRSIFCYVIPEGESSVEARSGLPSMQTNEKEAPGKIWIGFQTQQTTGFRAHLNTHSVIPTVERENIDFNARHVKTWNIAAMHAAGVLARIMYHYDTQDLLKPSDPKDLITKMGVIMQRYAFGKSTPRSTVGEKIKEAFFKTAFTDMLLLSTKGLVKVGLLRVGFPSDYSGNGFPPSSFLEGIPFLHPSLVGLYPEFEASLQELGMLKRVSVEEICSGLEGKILDVKKARSVISWAVSKTIANELTPHHLKKILDTLRVTVKEYDPVIIDARLTAWGTGRRIDSTRVLEFSKMKTFVNPQAFNPTSHHYGREQLYLPQDCIPPELTHDYYKAEPMRKVSGWNELDISTWIVGLAGRNPPPEPIFQSPTLLRDILTILSIYWTGLSDSDISSIKTSLCNRLCIPTNKGIVKPTAAYLPSVKWAGDIAIFDVGRHGPNISETLLANLGLQDSVELKIVLNSYMSMNRPKPSAPVDSPKGDRGHCYQLVNYILSSNNTFSVDEMNVLKNIPFCESEDYKGYGRLYTPSELYEPSERLRNLGLPVLKYPGPWDEVPGLQRDIIKRLGVQSHPSLSTLAHLAANLYITRERREDAFKYLVERLYVTPKNESSEVAPLRIIAFLPVELDLDYGTRNRFDETTLRKPSEIYQNPECSILGFPVLIQNLDKSIATRLEVPKDPPGAQLVSALISNPPTSVESATAIFRYFNSVDQVIAKGHYTNLGNAEIVPVLESDRVNHAVRKVKEQQRGFSTIRHSVNSQATIHLLRPNRIFLGAPKAQQFADFFDCVDFGTEANQFLTKCGAGAEPSDTEISKMMVMHPKTVLEFIGQAQYKMRLKFIAMMPDVMKRDLISFMQKEPWLLAVKVVDNPAYKPRTKRDGNDELVADADQPTIPVIELAPPSKIFVVDDVVSYKLCARHVLTCPEEDIIETFYTSLGSPKLSSRISARHLVTPPIGTELPHTPALMKKCEAHRKLIIERATLFFHEIKDIPMYDMKLWFKDFKVLLVTNIMIQRTLITDDFRTLEFRTEAKAAVPKEEAKSSLGRAQGNGKTLYVVGGHKMFDLARALLQAWMESPKMPDECVLEAFLREDLATLESRGVNIKRILKPQDEEDLHFNTPDTRLDAADDVPVPEPEPKAIKVEPEKKIPPISRERLGRSITPLLGPSKGKEVERDTSKPSEPSDKTDRNAFPFVRPQDTHQWLAGIIRKADVRRIKEDRSLGLNAAASKANPEVARSNLLSEKIAKDVYPDAPPPYDSNPQVSRPSHSLVNDATPPNDANLHVSHRSYDLAYHAISATGQKIYLEEGNKEESMQLYKTHKAAFDVFGEILGTISNVFGFDPATPNMFLMRAGPGFDKSDPAFHREESFFFNLKFFNDLHSEAVMVKSEPATALIYWFMAMCHALASNISNDPSKHSMHLASLATEFWIPMCRVLPPAVIYPSLSDLLQATKIN